MHELSIAQNIVERVTEQMRTLPGASVRSIRLKIGVLCAVHPAALVLNFECVSAGTPVEGAILMIDAVPLVIFCSNCNELRELPGIQRLACPKCQQRTADVRQGKELEIESLEIVDASAQDLPGRLTDQSAEREPVQP